MNLRKEPRPKRKKSFIKISTFPSLDGKTVVVTGKSNKYNREEIEKLITESGGFVCKSVNIATDYLLVGNRPGKIKLRAARHYNVQQIDLNTLVWEK